MIKVSLNTGSLIIDTNGVRAFELSASSGGGGAVQPSAIINDFTVIDGANLVFFVSGSSLANVNLSLATGSTLFYNKSTNFATRGDFEDAPGDTPAPFSNPNAASSASIVIPEINVQMKSETISAKTRKLKAQWTPEFAQDLNAYHSLDAEAELLGLVF